MKPLSISGMKVRFCMVCSMDKESFTLKTKNLNKVNPWPLTERKIRKRHT
jgi:hypothetical protein